MRSSIVPGHTHGSAGKCGPARMGADMRNFRVTWVERIENMTLWMNYQRQRAGLREWMRQHNHAPEQLVNTCLAINYVTGERVLDAEINEFGLWHGTKPEIADILAISGFDERVASVHELYGPGSYFADAMCKSNQYAFGAHSTTHTDPKGPHCMLYCRVTMGSAHKITTRHAERRPIDNPATPGAPYDSIFGDGRGERWSSSA